jgi:hypothetical protein
MVVESRACHKLAPSLRPSEEILTVIGIFQQSSAGAMRSLVRRPGCELVLPGARVGSATGSFDSLHIENDPVLLFNVAAHISATEVGVYVRRNNEPSGRRSSPSLKCSLLPGLRGHQLQSR